MATFGRCARKALAGSCAPGLLHQHLPVGEEQHPLEAEGLGLFVRSLVGLDREAAAAAFAEFSRGADFTAGQLRFIQMIIEHLTANGVMEPGRLFESPSSEGPGRVTAVRVSPIGARRCSAGSQVHRGSGRR